MCRVLKRQASQTHFHMSRKGFSEWALLLQAIERDRDAVRGDLQASRNRCADSEAEVSSCRAAAVEHAKQVSAPLFTASLFFWRAATVLSTLCCLVPK